MPPPLRLPPLCRQHPDGPRGVELHTPTLLESTPKGAPDAVGFSAKWCGAGPVSTCLSNELGPPAHIGELPVLRAGWWGGGDNETGDD